MKDFEMLFWCESGCGWSASASRDSILQVVRAAGSCPSCGCGVGFELVDGLLMVEDEW